MTRAPMSDTEIRRRKKVQAVTSQTTSTLGLAGVGVGTGALIASKKPQALRVIPRYKHLSRKAIKEKGNKLKDIGLYTSLASGGIGGIGGYNFAAYTRAESKKKNQIRKSDELMPIVGEIAKKWQPVATDYDPEDRRRSRNEFYPAAAAGVGGAGTTAFGVSAVERHLRSKRQFKEAGEHFKGAEKAQAEGIKAKRQKKAYRGIFNESKSRTRSGNTLKAAARGSRRSSIMLAGGAAATAATATGAHRYLKRKGTSREWASYSKAASPFGVEHD